VSAEVLNILKKILGKYQKDVGIVVWGVDESGTPRKILVKSDGTVIVEGIVTVSGEVDVTDRWSRQLGQVDIARYLGSAIGLANPLHSQIVYGGAVVDPRQIRALTAGDIVTVDNLLNPHPITATDLDIRNLSKLFDEVYAVLRTDAGVAYDARDRNWTITETLNVGNPPNLDVPLSTRASESSLTSELTRKVKGDQGLIKQVGAADLRLDIYASYVANPSNLDVALSTRASESKLEAVRALLDSLENALASVGTDKLRASIVDALPSGTNTIGNVGLSLKGTPNRLYATASGEVVAAPGTGYKLRVYGFYLCNEADEIARLRYGGSTGTVFAVCPSKGVAAMNLLGVNEAGGENQNIYLEKSGTGNTLAVVWTETVAA
jgi:hypothetical protein